MKLLKLALSTAAISLMACVSTSAQDMKNSKTKMSPPDIDINTPEGAIKAMRKVQCSLIDNEPITYYWHGRAYSRRMGERDQNIFNVEGMNIRSCSTVMDEEKGMGYKLVSREILLYTDPKTGEVLKTWENPWSGEEVEVMHVANDPVNHSGYITGRDGKPTKFAGDIIGDKFQMSITVPLFYPNPLASDYQEEIGGIYRATEMFNFMGDLDDLVDARKNTARISIGWVRMSDWLPWMKMSGREGVIYMHTAGRKIESWDEMSDRLKNEISMHYPEYVSAPPADDARKNVTSWGYYKDVKEGKVQLPKR